MKSALMWVTIPAGGTTSTATYKLDDDLALASIIMPSAWTAANLAFEASLDGTTWLPMHKGGSAISSSANADQFIKVTVDDFIGVPYLRLVASASQTAERKIGLLFVVRK